jgi:sulfate adenylyltransferase
MASVVHVIHGSSTTTHLDREATARMRHPGACIWLTGLSGSGKTTTATRLGEVLEAAGRTVTLLDGDMVRQQLFPERGFSRVDRQRNVLAVGWIAAEIVRHGGIAICALISPYRADREQVRSLVATDQFFEVFVDTPVDVCESRDVKGLYQQVRGGAVDQMTGIDDPYEPPLHADLRVGTIDATVDQNVGEILRGLHGRGLLGDGSIPGGPGSERLDDRSRGA